MDKKYNVYVPRVDCQTKQSIANSATIKPIKDLTQNILYWQQRDSLKSLLYEEVYLAKKQNIIATLQFLSNDDLLSLILEVKKDQNMILFDLCQEILECRMAKLTLDDIEWLFISKNTAYLTDATYFGIVRDIMIKKIQELSEEEQIDKAECYEYSRNVFSRKWLNGKKEISIKEYTALKEKSIEQIELSLLKSDLKAILNEQNLALVNIYRVLANTARNIHDNTETKKI